MTPESRIEFVEALIGSMVDQGMSLAEMEKASAVLADKLERNNTLTLDSGEKVSFVRGLVDSGANAAAIAALGLAGAGVAASRLGNSTGRMIGRLGDDEERIVGDIKRQELIDTLREHAALARLRNETRQ